MNDSVRLILTTGDPNGIGPEVLLRALLRTQPFTEWSPTLIGPASALRATIPVVDQSRLSIDRDHILVDGSRVPIIDLPFHSDIEPGVISGDAGKSSANAVIEGTRHLLAGKFDGIVTMPISKEAWKTGGIDWPGHTELISDLCGETGLMILMTDELRVALLTGHVPIERVSKSITRELIHEHTQTLFRTLQQDFASDIPRIAVLGLNPHAGDGGVLGNEEEYTYRPALEKLRDEGIDIEGPFPADAFFAREAWRKYDAVLASYHDQGLIPLKMLAEDGGVNYTAGLPIVRTSPDHGTAFDIAGQGVASGESAVRAIQAAISIVRNRKFNAEKE